MEYIIAIYIGWFTANVVSHSFHHKSKTVIEYKIDEDK